MWQGNILKICLKKAIGIVYISKLKGILYRIYFKIYACSHNIGNLKHSKIQVKINVFTFIIRQNTMKLNYVAYKLKYNM